jgi:hypothetical protein
MVNLSKGIGKVLNSSSKEGAAVDAKKTPRNRQQKQLHYANVRILDSTPETNVKSCDAHSAAGIVALFI